MELAEKTHRSEFDRRQRECSLPLGTADRRISECGPPLGSAERRVTAERRHPDVANIPIEEWANAMSNYYYLFQRI